MWCHSVGMAKEMMSFRVDADLRDALSAEAARERRSVGNMLELVLRERYSRAGSVGVSSAAAVGPVVHDVPVVPPRSWKSSAEMGSAARTLASRDGKCGADVARGTKCKLCGSVH